MKTAIELRATAVRGRAEAPGRVIVAGDAADGFLCQALMGPPGVMLKAGLAHIMIPMAEFWSLAEKLDPRFRVPAAETKSQGLAQQRRVAEGPQCLPQSGAGMPALIIQNLKGQYLLDQPFPFHTIFSVAEEPVAGFIREVDFGLEGALLTVSGAQLQVPLSVMFKLASDLDPAFRPPSSGPLFKIS